MNFKFCKYTIALMIVFLLLSAIIVHAENTSAEEYLAIKKSSNAMQISLAQLKSNPLEFADKTIEFCGVVNGKATSNNSISFMINCGTDNILISTDKELPSCLEDNAVIRVLAAVPTDMSIGAYNLVAVAYEHEVTALEKAQAKKPAKAVSKKTVTRDLTNKAFIEARQTGNNLSSRAMKIYNPYREAISKFNPKLTVSQLDSITKSVLSCSEKYGVDPRLVVAIILAESNFKPNAVSRAGAMGLGQLMPKTAKGMGVNNAYDTHQNIDASVRLICGHLKKYSNIDLALAAYNAGPGAVKKYGGVPPYKETQNYVKKVKGIYKQFCGE